MQTTFKIFISCLFCLALLLVNGCGSQSSSLVGKWEVDTESVFVYRKEFFRDGTGVAFSDNTGRGTDFSWKTEDDRVVLTFHHGMYDATAILDYKISGTTLTLTYDGGYSVVYKKQNAWGAPFTARAQQTFTQLEVLTAALQQYNADHRGYPTTEQGLMSLVFIPENVGLHSPQDPMGGMMGQRGMTGAPDPLTGMPIADPMRGGTIGGQMVSMQPTHNLQLYTQLRRRPNPYIQESDLLDPWGRPFRYDNSRAFFGLNRTGTEVPAVWSAGRDGIDGTDDDILGWDPDVAAELIARQQQQLQMQQQGNRGYQQGFDPMRSPGMPQMPPGGSMPGGMR
jgi:type II secretory pathway pseudopilin PulG